MIVFFELMNASHQWHSQDFWFKWVAGGEGLGAEPPALGDFCNFSVKITHFYAYLAKIVILKQ